MKHLTSLLNLTVDEVREILRLAHDLKTSWRRGERPALLQGRYLTQVFEKPSLRTRVSFDAAMAQLGGTGLFLSGADAGLSGRESLADVARVISSYSDAVVLRTFSQKLIEEFASHSNCSIINGLSDDDHPCQALTDILTLQEVWGDVTGKRLVFVGDGNNVANSLAAITSMLGMSMTVCAPRDFELDEELLQAIRLRYPQSDITQMSDPNAALANADVVYTDVWASMGQESEADRRNKIFTPYQVNARMMAKAPAGCLFMHDLPARRGKEVTDDVIDGPNSIVFQQAENRMHLAKGLLVWLIGPQ
ncbi:MAG TPA: ornithine carbamoyltransferase [Planctomycetaceae bacterium]|nr:ornithine carbamoyltransferase [Planctomycetaceae bacterium]